MLDRTRRRRTFKRILGGQLDALLGAGSPGEGAVGSGGDAGEPGDAAPQ